MLEKCLSNANGENSSLLGNQDSTRVKRLKIAGISCTVLISSGISTAIFFSKFKPKKTSGSNPDNESPVITFDFEVPQQGKGKIIIHNNGDAPAKIVSIQFSTNAIIHDVPVGALSPIGSSIESISQKGFFTHYKLNEPTDNLVVIEPGSSKDFTYSFSKTSTALNISYVPKDITVAAESNTYQAPLIDQCQGTQCNNPFPNKMVGSYFQENDAIKTHFNVKNINPRLQNRIIYSSLTFDTNGNIALNNPNIAGPYLTDLMKIQRQYPYFKVSISFGDKNATKAFQTLASNAQSRANFANNVVNFLNQYNFNGININWEFPGQQDGYNFVTLARTLRQQFNASATSYELTVVGPAMTNDINQLGFRLFDLSNQIDALHLKSHAYNGPFSRISDYQAPMSLPSNDPTGASNSISGSLTTYQHYLFPPEKIIIIIPTDYLGSKVNSMNKNGIWQTVIGAPDGQFGENGRYLYACVVANQCHGGTAFPSNCQFLNENEAFIGNYSKTPLITCQEEQYIFSGESVTSVSNKTELVITSKLKGLFFSSASGDVQNNDHNSLLVAAQNEFAKHGNTTESVHPKRQANSIVNEQQWSEFVSNLQTTLTYSFLGGASFSLLFGIVDTLTDSLLAKFFKDKQELIEDATLFYSIKTVVYLSTLYSVGAPLLPGLAGKFIGDYLQTFMKVNAPKSALAGSLSSFFINLGINKNTLSLPGIVTAASSLLASLGGSFSLGYVVEKLPHLPRLSFFSNLQITTNEVDEEKGMTLSV